MHNLNQIFLYKKKTDKNIFYYYRWLIKSFFRGIIAKNKNKSKPSHTHVDILVLHGPKKPHEIRKINKIVEQLKYKKINTIEYFLEDEKEILTKNLLYKKTNSTTPTSLAIYDYYAQYIINRFTPQIIISFKNGSLLSPFLMAHKSKDCKVIHIAHSILSNQSHRFSMGDYDHYLLFGRSSLNYLKNLDFMIGNPKISLTGNFNFDKKFNISIPKNNKKILLLGMGPNYERKPTALKSYHIIQKWISTRPEYTLHVKPHMRSTISFWQDAAKNNRNIRLYPTDASLADCLKETSIALAVYTNAVLDAAITGRPSLLVGEDSIADHLEVERFIHQRCQSVEELDLALQDIEHNFEEYSNKALTFADYHLEHKQNSLKSVVETIQTIYKGESIDFKTL